MNGDVHILFNGFPSPSFGGGGPLYRRKGVHIWDYNMWDLGEGILDICRDPNGGGRELLARHDTW